MMKDVKLPFWIGGEGAVAELVDIVYRLFVSPVFTALSIRSKYDPTGSSDVARENSFN
jgi:hypothetical protein